MRGKLSDTPFPDIARRLSNDDVTGALEVTGEPGVARVFFRTGAVYWAMSPAPRARLGDRLVNAGFITQEQLDKALDEQQKAEERTKLGALLVEKELVGRDVIRVFVQEQILDALFDLVRWQDGEYVFHPGDAVDDKLPIDVPVSQMLVEVSRRQNEWDQIQRSIPTLDAVPDHVVGGNAATAALEQDEFTMLASIDGNRSVRELAGDLGYSEFEAGRIVYGLTLLGIVEILGEEDDEDDEPTDAPPLAQDPADLDELADLYDEADDDVDEAAAGRQEQADLDAALADVLSAGADLPDDAPDDAVAPDEDDIDVGAALEHALFGEEPEPEPDDQGLQVTVHFALDDGVAERSAHGRPEGAVPADAVPTPAPAEPDASDEPEPWVFTAEDEPGDDQPAPADPAPAGTPPTAPAAADDDLGALDDFFAGPATTAAAGGGDAGASAAEVDDLFADDASAPTASEPSTTELTQDLDDLMADLAGDEAPRPVADATPAPPPGSSAPGAPPPGGEAEPTATPPARSGGRGDVSEFLRELTQLNLGDEGDDDAANEDDDADDDDGAAAAAPTPPPVRRPPPPQDDKKKKGLFGWGR